MNKIFLVLLFVLTSCGYQPIYLNKNLENIEYSKIDLKGDERINKKIISTLPISENEQNQNQIFLISSYNVEPASKNSSGQIISYRTIIKVNLEIRDVNNKTNKKKGFVKRSVYNNKQNNFELVDYQDTIKNDLINIIIGEIIIFLNS
mgnify:FL=1